MFGAEWPQKADEMREGRRGAQIERARALDLSVGVLRHHQLKLGLEERLAVLKVPLEHFGQRKETVSGNPVSDGGRSVITR